MGSLPAMARLREYHPILRSWNAYPARIVASLAQATVEATSFYAAAAGVLSPLLQRIAYVHVRIAAGVPFTSGGGGSGGSWWRDGVVAGYGQLNRIQPYPALLECI